METQNDVTFSVLCEEPEGAIMRYVRPLILTPENIQKFWDKARQFPSLYGKEILNDPQSFIDMFTRRKSNGEFDLNGLLWVIDDFVGVFYLSDITHDRETPVDALVHYTFFDKRHKGRKLLVKGMIHYVFTTFMFRRLSIELPNYSKATARHFATDVGFHYEGKKLKAAKYKGDWFDVNLYGILREGVVNGKA